MATAEPRLEGDALRDDIKARLTMLQASAGREEAREYRRKAAVLDAIGMLHDAADAIVRGNHPVLEFAKRLVSAAEELEKV